MASPCRPCQSTTFHHPWKGRWEEVGKMRERDKNCLFFNRTVNLFGLGVKGHLHGDAWVITVRLWQPPLPPTPYLWICWALSNLSSNTVIFMDCIILCRNVLYCPQNKLFLKVIGKLEMAAIGWFLNTLFLKCGLGNDPVGVKRKIYLGRGNWSISPLSNGNFYQGLSVYVNERCPGTGK